MRSTVASVDWSRREIDATLRFLTTTILLDDQSILTDCTDRSGYEGGMASDEGCALFDSLGDFLLVRICGGERA